MTLTMADSITAANLPPGYDAYAGYVDGSWPDYPAVVTRFPGARLWSVTVTGSGADECDCETGDLTPARAVAWARSRLAAGMQRPGIYASASTMAAGVLPALSAAGVARAGVRLRSAHYGAGEHICGPGTCKLVPVTMDGTQWTDQAPGEDGTLIDASLLADDFFGATPAAPAPTGGVFMLPELQQGATGPAVGALQGALSLHPVGHGITVDGDFGPDTSQRLRAFQGNNGLAADGVAGPLTYARLI